jgi:hypothetical protein
VLTSLYRVGRRINQNFAEAPAGTGAFRFYIKAHMGWAMKPLPAPRVPGKTESERFDNALRQVFSVSKDELLKREAREKRKKERKTEQKRK